MEPDQIFDAIINLAFESLCPGITMADYVTIILSNWLSLQTLQQDILGELSTINVRLQDTGRIGDRLDEATAVSKARNIAKESMLFNESTKTMTAHFFYSENNRITQQLRGRNYFAYNTLSELFVQVHLWNKLADEITKDVDNDPTLSRFMKRKTIVHLWDHSSSSAKVLSYMDFPKSYQSIAIDNHCQAKSLVILESVRARCFVELNNVTVYKLDAAYGGEAHLKNSHIGWNQSPQAPVPFLFGGSLDDFTSANGNPYNVCGTVRCTNCTTVKNGPRPSYDFVSRKATEGVATQTDKHYIIERTISNISDAMWFVKFEANVGDITLYCDNFDLAKALDNKNCASTCSHGAGSNTCTGKSEKVLPFAAIPPNGGQVTFSVACPRGFMAKNISGTLIFIDNNGGQYQHRYFKSLTNYTITSPVIATRTIEPCTQTVPKNTILVVGPVGNGKSTFLNALAGVYWKVASPDGNGGQNFVANPDAAGRFPVGTGESDIGFIQDAGATNIMTFDGWEMTVIDTVGYNGSLSGSSLYDQTNKEISAVLVCRIDRVC